MAAFPTLRHRTDSTRSGDDGTLVDQAEDGVVRVRHMYATTVWQFAINLGPLTSSEKDSVLSHYDTHKQSLFSYTWPGDGSTYTVLYKKRPQIKEADDAWNMWYVNVELVGT